MPKSKSNKSAAPATIAEAATAVAPTEEPLAVGDYVRRGNSKVVFAITEINNSGTHARIENKRDRMIDVRELGELTRVDTRYVEEDDAE